MPADTRRARTLDPQNLAGLEAWLKTTLAAGTVRITAADLLTGGAVQENWRIDAVIEGGPRAGTHAWVLRTDAVARLAVSLDRTAEYSVLAAAYAAGVKVAEPIARCDDPTVIGAPFMIQARMPGDAQARRLTRATDLAQWGPAVARELGAELAKIHRLRPGGETLAFLPVPLTQPAKVEIGRFRAVLDKAGEPRPALEYILAWLDRNTPEAAEIRLVHGDFRTGNYLVADGHVSAILDWEFAHWGDVHEDIGWFCAQCWRFGNDHLEAGGIAPREALLEGYRSLADWPVDEARIAYWRVMAAAKWATVAVLQGDRYRLGGETSLELALTGLMASEIELEALDGINAIEGLR